MSPSDYAVRLGGRSAKRGNRTGATQHGEPGIHIHGGFSCRTRSAPFGVFIAAALALCLSTGLAVLLGSVGARYLDGIPLKLIAGIGFIAIGAWSLVEHIRAA